MNKTEAKIIALETFANSVDVLIESDMVSNSIRTSKDCELINAAFDELAASLRERAERLRSRNVKEVISTIPHLTKYKI